jgi:sulfide dehydrogenase cytochrome subunit
MAHKTLKFALIAGVLSLATSGVATADGASASMLSDTCFGCHGTEGASAGPATPSISGISKDYFVEIMNGFASGDVPSTIMGRIAKGYTEDEITTMAKYFSSQEFIKAKQDFDPTLAKTGAKLHDKYCEKCHAEGGSSAEDDSGILNGQWSPYVKWTLSDFTEGHRDAPKKMNKQLKKLVKKEGDAGINALLNYYASGK